MKKFSIVVPVYNIDDYVGICIKSILKQSFKDYELILVDDGSTDNSLKVCREFAKKDSRIKIIEKLNSGVSDARNTGINASEGEYICFVDGDDFMVVDSLVKFYTLIENDSNADLILGKMDELESGSKYIQNSNYYSSISDCNDNIEILSQLVSKNELVWNVFSHIYKRSFLIKNKLFFGDGQLGSEDLDFVIRYIISPAKIVVFNESLCCYRSVREGSATTKFNYLLLKGELKMSKYWFDYFIEESVVSESNRKVLCTFFSSEFIRKVSNMYKIHGNPRKELIEFIKLNRYIISYPSTTKNKMISILYHLFGIIIGTNILNIYHKVKKTS